VRSDKHGAINAIESLIYTLSAAMPAKIATANAATSADIVAHLAGPYVLSASKTLILSLNNGAAITATISAGTYTAAQLAAVLNAVAAFSAIFTATTTLGARHLEIYVKTRGASCSIKVGAGTINTILGIVTNTIYNYHPLRDIEFFKMQDQAADDMIPAYPAFTFSLTGVECSDDMEHPTYSIEGRLYEACNTPSGDEVNLLGRHVLMLSDIAVDAIHDGNTDLHGQVSAAYSTGYSMAEMDSYNTLYRAHSTISFTVMVQEPLD